MRSNSRQTGLRAASAIKRARARLRGDVKMNSRTPTNASENGGGEPAGHNGKLLIANDFLVARLGLGTMRLTEHEFALVVRAPQPIRVGRPRERGGRRHVPA